MPAGASSAGSGATATSTTAGRSRRICARTREQLRLAVDATGTGIFDYDLVADVLNWDTRTRAFFGLGPDDPGQPRGLSWPACTRTTANAPIRRSRAALDPAGGGTYDITYRTIDPESGSSAGSRPRARPLFDGRTNRCASSARRATSPRAAGRRQVAAGDRGALPPRRTRHQRRHLGLGPRHQPRPVERGAPDRLRPLARRRRAHRRLVDRPHPPRRPAPHRRLDPCGHRRHRHDLDRRVPVPRADGTYADVLDRGYVIRDGTGAPCA